MDSTDNYLVVCVEGDAWLTGIFGDNWYANMTRIDFNIPLSDSETVPYVAKVTAVNSREYRLLLTNGYLVSVRADELYQVIATEVEDIAGPYYLTSGGEVIRDRNIIKKNIEAIFGHNQSLIMVDGNVGYSLRGAKIIEARNPITYAVTSGGQTMYVDNQGRLYANNVELKGTFSTYGVEKIVNFDEGEWVILDRKGVLHFLGNKSNRALGLNARENSNVLETPFVVQNVETFKKIIVVIDQTDRLWSFSSINPARVGWQAITEVNRSYHPEDDYPVTYV